MCAPRRRPGATTPSLVDALLAADEQRRAVVSRADTLRGEQKAVSQSVKRATPDERPAVLERAKALAGQVKELEAQQAAVEAALRQAHLAVPNVVQGAPPGGEQDFVVLEQVGEVPTYDFPVRDHLDVGTVLKAIDTERGAKVSGSRFAFLTGPGALLELALVNHAMALATAAGLVPVIAPALVRPEAMEGTGFLGAHAAEVYKLEADDLYLVGTSEVPLAAYHSGESLEELPLRYAGFSSCFRREAGSHGKDTRGIIRVHQFDKVEMFSYVALEDAEAEHQRLLDAEKAVPALARADRSASSTSRPATSAAAPRASTTARRGCRRRSAGSSSPRRATAPTSRPVGSASAGRAAAASPP